MGMQQVGTLTVAGISAEVHFDSTARYPWSLTFTRGHEQDCQLVFDSLAVATAYFAAIVVGRLVVGRGGQS